MALSVERGINILSMKPTSLPVRPPTLLNDSATPFAAPVMAGPAVAVTLERPWAALVEYSETVAETLAAVSLAVSLAVSPAFSVAFFAFVLAVDSNLRAAMRPQAAPDCRSIGRAKVDDDDIFYYYYCVSPDQSISGLGLFFIREEGRERGVFVVASRRRDPSSVVVVVGYFAV